MTGFADGTQDSLAGSSHAGYPGHTSHAFLKALFSQTTKCTDPSIPRAPHLCAGLSWAHWSPQETVLLPLLSRILSSTCKPFQVPPGKELLHPLSFFHKRKIKLNCERQTWPISTLDLEGTECRHPILNLAEVLKGEVNCSRFIQSSFSSLMRDVIRTDFTVSS